MQHSVPGVLTPIAVDAPQVLDQGQTRERVLLGLQDFLYTFQELKTEPRQRQLAARGLDFPSYVGLMSDAVLWQIKTVAKDATKVRRPLAPGPTLRVHGSRAASAHAPCALTDPALPQEVFTTLLSKYRETCNDSMVLKHILTCFSARLYVTVTLARLAAPCLTPPPAAFLPRVRAPPCPLTAGTPSTRGRWWR